MKFYEIVTITEDFGRMKDEKTGKFNDWKGRRLVCMEYDKDDKSGVIYQGTTRIYKASKDLSATVPTGKPVDLYCDMTGRVKKVEVLNK